MIKSLSTISSIKGTPTDVHLQKLYSKTKCPLTIEHTHRIRILLPIGILPSLEPLTHSIEPSDNSIQPMSLVFDSTPKVCHKLDLEWYMGVVTSIKSLEYKNTLIENLNLDYANIK